MAPTSRNADMTKIFAIAFAFTLVAAPVFAQNQAAATRIADAAQQTNILVDPVDCLERAANVFGSPSKAASYCDKIYKQGGKIVTKVANEAADATKNSRPVVVAPSGYPVQGYGYYQTRTYYMPRGNRQAPRK